MFPRGYERTDEAVEEAVGLSDRNVNTVEKTARSQTDRLKSVTQEEHRLKPVLRVLAGFSCRARKPRAEGPRPITRRPRKPMVYPTEDGNSSGQGDPAVK